MMSVLCCKCWVSSSRFSGFWITLILLHMIPILFFHLMCPLRSLCIIYRFASLSMNLLPLLFCLILSFGRPCIPWFNYSPCPGTLHLRSSTTPIFLSYISQHQPSLMLQYCLWKMLLPGMLIYLCLRMSPLMPQTMR